MSFLEKLSAVLYPFFGDGLTVLKKEATRVRLCSDVEWSILEGSCWVDMGPELETPASGVNYEQRDIIVNHLHI